VLDIRNNGGGLFPVGVQVAKMFINTGDIVLIADSQGIRDVYSADFSAIVDKQPMAVSAPPEPLVALSRKSHEAGETSTSTFPIPENRFSSTVALRAPPRCSLGRSRIPDGRSSSGSKRSERASSRPSSR